MALQISSFENPFDPANPLANVYAWTASLGLDIFAGTGRVTLNVNPNPEAWQAPPIGQIPISLGEVVERAVFEDGIEVSPEVRVKTLAELMADPEFAQAYQVIGSKLYLEAKKHPKLKNSQIV